MFPSLYYFKNTPNIPDGNETYLFDYSIFHLGTRLKLLTKPAVNLEVDYYNNFESYQANDSILTAFKNQKTGLILGVSAGKLQEKGDWITKVTYTYLQQYAAVDFLAQNDWTRWNYSAFSSPGGRLTNFKGFEFMMGYVINKKLILNMRYFKVDQLIPYGISLETGNRIRLDLDIGF